MYAYLYGKIVEKEADNLVIEVNQIGYNVHIAEGMLSRFPDVGQICKVHTYTSVREDAFWLYGFSSKEELYMFKLLITVSGIGPKAAMGILSAMDVSTIQMAIISGDSKMLSKAPGVGAKSASRIVLELKDKVGLPSTSNGVVMQEAANVGVISVSQGAAEAVNALTMLGFSSGEASAAVGKLDSTLPVEDLVRLALKELGKRG